MPRGPRRAFRRGVHNRDGIMDRRVVRTRSVLGVKIAKFSAGRLKAGRGGG